MLALKHLKRVCVHIQQPQRRLSGVSITPEPTPSIYPHSHIKPPPNFDATKFRQWIELSPKNGNPSISIMTFNLLSQHYVWKKVFGDLDQNYLDWTHYRFPLINQTISQFQCDIMCFQELECSVYENSWKSNFPLKNYSSVYMRKPNPKYWGTKPSEFMDGVGVFVNSERFDVVDYYPINYGNYVSEHPDRFDLTDDVVSRVIPRNTVALILKLWDKQAEKTVYVTNTHLYWSPKFNDVKLIQTKILLNELARLIGEEENPCIIMCGDYNSTPNSLVFKLLKDGKVKVDTAEEFADFDYGHKIDGEPLDNEFVKSPFDLTPAYGPLLKDGSPHKLDFTSYSKNLTEVLDHIWFSSATFEANRVLGKVEGDYSAQASGFPDRQFPSDHIPLVSEISYI
ncbi:Endonuclease/Exonuclease/phosphatase family protein [Clavispora lusitaniae]|uniref:Endonuclease/exonuclease/phosphatase domain-containing protein n=1 Tax=Clavispora lusitaniae (strain ATCC 42720) TaxID=306902 RepID=C4XZC5_CLAL4|nr:uncharacterized protein CLUG_01307 [Clavispora lusitaniae ATCC 42720]EEQ37184.1 hypothetical protein CLUG_01307 [Clavispora lusitaniae ATCC 42720]KAF5212414.1 hypothetical protein E0198_001979 [Clavispora lusitaniae]KAF7583833.1 Endonuclease/Exonuclease/phosphatase family protein [Clavispora lusitaniae]